MTPTQKRRASRQRQAARAAAAAVIVPKRNTTTTIGGNLRSCGVHPTLPVSYTGTSDGTKLKRVLPSLGTAMPMRVSNLHSLTPQGTRDAAEGAKAKRSWDTLAERDGQMGHAIATRKEAASSGLGDAWATQVEAHHLAYNGPVCRHDEIPTACQACRS